LDILWFDFVSHFVGHFVETVFSHEKPSVCQKALICVSSLNGLSRTWDKHHFAQMLHAMADG
jgi:hypothetical protein